jgi:hypothetical protein
MGTATASLNFNSVYLGVDWRHWQSTGVRTGTERVLRGVIDFFETNGGITVPVQLASFDAKARGRNVDVSWSTASEQGTDRFEIERSDALAGTDDTYGTTQDSREYYFRDVNVPSGRYLYRLTTVDRDGARGRSGSVEVEIGADGNGVITITPQPVTTEARLSIELSEGGLATIEIVNNLGQVVDVRSNVTVISGTQMLNLPVTGLANGTYTVVVTIGEMRLTVPMVIRR